ncbi:MAG: precorrin-3B synthase [Pseudochelatococcus sp.]|jgi:precorrin-3B synthase|uniref:precorrin-3B synthase n=1 Tax=Pseudochelatococcus sp. TaxID=2020869 RepID=UPI003D8F87D2
MSAPALSGAPASWRRRGACPSLARPMPTGDGLLARLNPAEGELSAAQLADVAQAALTHGNGLVEITTRASLQIRGLAEAGAAGFGEAIAASGLSLRSGLPVETGPLAGLDAGAHADPRPLLHDLRRRAAAMRLAERLGPKVSVAIDDGGALPPGASGADIRLEAIDARNWRLRTNGRMRDGLDAERAATITLSLLQAIARKGPDARARDLADSDLADNDLADDDPAMPAGGFVSDNARVKRPTRPPVGVFPLIGGRSAHGVALPFGRTGAETLLAVARAAAGGARLRLAPSGLLAIGLPPMEAARWREAAQRHGLIAEPHDPRLAIHACAGAPACGSAHIDTQALAETLSRLPGLAGDGVSLHVFGCGKQCARPSQPAVTLTGHADGCSIAASGVSLDDGMKAALLDAISLHTTKATA